jgi:glutaminyl-tRNA synthetase
VKEIKKDSAGNVTGVICTCTEVDKVSSKPKAFIHWVSEPVKIEIRLYSSLFKHKNPEDPVEVPGGFVTDCNRDSLKILESFADKTLKSAKIFDKFQFERNGFFSVDPDTSAEKLIFNQTVGLKEDAGK